VRAVIQRVRCASVTVGEERVADIGRGLVVLLGVAAGDGPEDAAKLARKTAELRIFADAAGRFNLSLLDISGQALVVSQFTLLADTRKGRRPSFTQAAPPEEAEPLVDSFCAALCEAGIEVQTGRFGARMLVEIQNDGPVTIILDSGELERPRRG
jgi:D-tyrosyl-tRNA(Tyr) deacylase